MKLISSTRELQATCDSLYKYFVKRLSQVTETEEVKDEHGTYIYLYIVKTTPYRDNCLQIEKWNDTPNACFWADGNNGLLFHTDGAIEIVKQYAYFTDNRMIIRQKTYINRNSNKKYDAKRRAILLELQAKLKELFKDYL